MKTFTQKAAALIAAAALALPGAAVATAAAAGAQSAPPPAAAPAGPGEAAPHRGGHMKKMLESLNLSDSQKQQIDGIMQSTKQKNENADPQTRRANMKAAFDQINGILTPAQRTQLQGEMDAARAQREKENGMQGPAQPSPAPAK